MASRQDQRLDFSHEVRINRRRHIRKVLSLQDDRLELELHVIGLVEARVVPVVFGHHGKRQEILPSETFVAFPQVRFDFAFALIHPGRRARVLHA